MSDYLIETKELIDKNFQYIINWDREISVIWSIDPTFLITKKNFLIVWINSVNEFLLEQIILIYYKKYFDRLLTETGYSIYVSYELNKIEQAISQNHDGSFNWFDFILSKIMWTVISRWLIKSIEVNFAWNMNLFKEKLREIYNFRNKLGHSSEFYFINNKDISFDITKLWNYIDILRNWFIELSVSYEKVMNDSLMPST